MEYVWPARSVCGKSTKTAPNSRSYLSSVVPRRILSTCSAAWRSSWMRVSSLSILKRMVTLPLRNFFSGSTRTSKMVVEQIVVGAILAVRSAQDVCACWRCGSLRRCGGRGLLGSLRGRFGCGLGTSAARGEAQDKKNAEDTDRESSTPHDVPRKWIGPASGKVTQERVAVETRDLSS